MYLSYKNNHLSLLCFVIFIVINQVTSLSESCDLISPKQYKVKEGVTNFTFLLQMEAKFVGDATLRSCSFGILIEDLLCVDLTQTLCCCNNFTRKSIASCQIRSSITKNTNYMYQGLAQINGSTGAVCSGVIQFVIQTTEEPSNLGLIIGLIGGAIVLVIVGIIVYKKFIRKSGKDTHIEEQKEKPSSSANLKKSLINSNSNESQQRKRDSFSNHSIDSNLYEKNYKDQGMRREQPVRQQKDKNRQRQEYQRYLFQKQRQERDYLNYLRQKQAKQIQRQAKIDPKLAKNDSKINQNLTDSVLAKQYSGRESFK